MEPKQEKNAQEKKDLVSVSRKLRDILQEHASGKPVIRTMAENIALRAKNRG